MLKKIRHTFKKHFHDHYFITTVFSIFINPTYILRNGLYRAIMKNADKISGDILDFGCGSKPYEKLFKKAKTYVGVDKKISGHNHNDSKIDHFYDGKKLPFHSKKFDSIVSFEVFEHVFNINEVLKEINRVLKNDGSFLLSIPFAWEEHEQPYDFSRYTSYGIIDILEKNGFEIISSTKTTTYFLALSQMFIAFFSQHVFSQKKIIKKILQICILFPICLISICLDKFIPKKYEYYCNLVILAKKNSTPSKN